MSELPQLVGGELNAALTREMVRIHAANLGRGPKKSFTFYNGNIAHRCISSARAAAGRSR